MSLEDIREVYSDQAETMDRLEWANRLFTGRYRRRLFSKACGEVLDVACGTGTNHGYIPQNTDYTGIDASPDMLEKARKNLPDRNIQLKQMDAQNLRFEDNSFDTVISSLSTCTFPEPQKALSEIQRVCRPDGHILLLEHGRSNFSPVARFQDWRAEAHFRKHACRWNQRPIDLIRDSEIELLESTSSMLGIITMINARP